MHENPEDSTEGLAEGVRSIGDNIFSEGTIDSESCGRGPHRRGVASPTHIQYAGDGCFLVLDNLESEYIEHETCNFTPDDFDRDAYRLWWR